MVYLDHAATSSPPAPGVASAVNQALQFGFGNPGRGGHSAALRSGHVLAAAREAVADCFGSGAVEQFVLTPSCTMALNMALMGLPLGGGHVVTTVLEHNALLRPLALLQKNGVIAVTHLRPDAMGRITPLAVAEALRPNTRLVAMAHASNVTGLAQPLEEIGKLCRARGVWLLVDAAQSVGHLPYALDDHPFDLLAFCGHKGLCGPMGTGGLYVREGIPLAAVLRGGTGSHSEVLDPPDEVPDAFESGTPNLPGLAGLTAAARYMTAQKHRAAFSMKLTARLFAGVREIPTLRVILPQGRDPDVPVVSVTSTALSPGQLSQKLSAQGICARAGLHCAPLIHAWLGTPEGTLRLSPGFGNTFDDIDYAVCALRRSVRSQ